MKRLLSTVILTVLVSVTCLAQVYTYRTTDYAYKQVNSSTGKWSGWSDWQDSNMTMVINFNTDVVTIFSPTTQRYKITKFVREFTDNSGGKQVEFAFVDQDGDKGHMRLRIEKNGNSQVYVEFSNIMWVYNVRRTD